jgi:rubrerythrin
MIEVHGMSRQAFLLRATLAAGAAYGATTATPFITRALAQDGGGDIDIVNYALTLEYLESDFYARAAKQAKGLRADERRLVIELRDNELEHVDALKATVRQLGGIPARKPTFAFGDAFGSRAAFLKTANTLEDTGVSAYNGAAPRIESKEILVAAGGIAQVEARHAALIRLARDKPPAPLAFDLPSSEEKVLAAVKPLMRK